MKTILKRLLRSKKFIAMLMGMIAPALSAKLGVEPEVVMQMLYLLMGYLGVQTTVDVTMAAKGNKTDPPS